MNTKADDPTRSTTDGVTPGYENDATAPGPVKPNGQHVSYWILSEDERAKGFVRPVRRSYTHVGAPGPQHPTRPINEADARERDLAIAYGYVSFEAYPPEANEGSVTGCYWTRARLDRAGKGCGTVTTMTQELAETYARKPDFYAATFCYGCGKHLPVGKAGEFVWDGTTERVGT